MAPFYHKPRKGSLRPRIKSKRGQVIERHSAGELKDVVGPLTSVTGSSTSSLPHQSQASGFHWRQNEIPLVEIFDASCIFPFNRRLAASYIIDSRDPDRMCDVNAAAAASAGRHDLAQIWNLVKQAVGRVKIDAVNPWNDAAPWFSHPYGYALIESVMRHLVAQSDVQTLSLISCVFRKPDGKSLDSECSSPCLSVDGSTATYESAASSQLPNDSVLLRRSSSWCEMNYEVLQPPPETTVAADCCIEPQPMSDSSIFALPAPPSNEVDFLRRCDRFKAVYAELLYRWQLLVKRSELLKCTSQTPTAHRGLELAPVCVTCDPSSASQSLINKEKTSLSCTKCKKAKLTCVICRLRVKGLSTFCPSCSHGGHSTHMVSWFKTHDVCPTGCGCRCLQLRFGATVKPSPHSGMNSKDSSTASLKREEDSESLLSGYLPSMGWN